MKIGISINEVLRDFVGQFGYVYSKYINEVDLKENPVTEWNLIDFFSFDNEEELNKFLYTEASYEVFAIADQLHDNVVTKLNGFITEMTDEEHEVILISREANKSIPSTLFFLSKLGFTGSNIQFVMDTVKKWDDIDILITANPIALNGKPKGKISVKVNSTYNKGIESDYEIDNIINLFENEDLLEKILEND